MTALRINATETAEARVWFEAQLAKALEDRKRKEANGRKARAHHARQRRESFDRVGKPPKRTR